MSAISERRERERAHRRQLIITAARELAETEGWEAVTTRRLAERVEYSQPVLYSHFNGKDAIVSAVALDGFSELAAHLRRARQAAPEPGQALRAVCRAYLEFPTERPALYQAMFSLPTDLKFASAETPPPLRAASASSSAASARTTSDANYPPKSSGARCTAWPSCRTAAASPRTDRRNGSISSSPRSPAPR
jgi:AcrR family transcriptional regulator